MNRAQWQRLVAALHDSADESTAVAAAGELQSIASMEDVPHLLELLSDDSFFVREAAAWPLSDLGCVSALPQLLAAYQRGLDDGHDNDGFSAALVDLVSVNRGEAKAQLETLAHSPDQKVARTAKWLLEFCEP